VLWTLEELAVEYELKIVNLKQAGQKEDQYRRFNPMMKVPALTDGDVVVTETGAILHYLAEKNSPPCLLPQLGDAARPRCIRWLFFVGSNFEPAAGERFNGWTPDPYYNGVGGLRQVRDVIAEALTEGSWLLGECFTVADIYLASDLRIACEGKLIVLTGSPSPATSVVSGTGLHLLERPRSTRTRQREVRTQSGKGGASISGKANRHVR
jgi:glutathione S-transferase